MRVKTWIVVVISALLLIILFQNLGLVSIHLLFWTIDISLLLVMLLPFIFGIIVGWLLRSVFLKRKTEAGKL